MAWWLAELSSRQFFERYDRQDAVHALELGIAKRRGPSWFAVFCVDESCRPRTVGATHRARGRRSTP
jgi:hypothetical protein